MGKAELPLHAPGTQVDRGYIGQSVPRANAQRLLQGRGSFTDDLRFPRLAHAVFFRSPYAHANVKRLEFKQALRAPGVIGVFDGRAVAEYCTPWVAVLAHLKVPARQADDPPPVGLGRLGLGVGDDRVHGEQHGDDGHHRARDLPPTPHGEKPTR